jgi:hypothetical protein
MESKKPSALEPNTSGDESLAGLTAGRTRGLKPVLQIDALSQETKNKSCSRRIGGARRPKCTAAPTENSCAHVNHRTATKIGKSLASSTTKNNRQRQVRESKTGDRHRKLTAEKISQKRAEGENQMRTQVDAKIQAAVIRIRVA